MLFAFSLAISMDSTISIGGLAVGLEEEVFTIAEIGLAHDGSLGAAHAYVDAVANIGADAVKFQTHIAEEESTEREKFRVKVFPQDVTRFDYWNRTAFCKSQWIELADHARERGLFFLSSPFSNLAVDWLMECGVVAWKVASGEVRNRPMLEHMCATGLPLLISSGMSSWAELDEVVDFVQRKDAKLGVMQCTSAYPCPPASWGLNAVTEMRSRYGLPVGFSDHSGSLAPCIAATAIGASIIEFHIAFSCQQFGPDASASLDLESSSLLVPAVKATSEARNNPFDKDKNACAMRGMRETFMKSVVARKDLRPDHVLTIDDLAFKKPCVGISAWRYEQLIGQQLTIAVKKDHFFSLADFE